jgi:hypothetical protein
MTSPGRVWCFLARPAGVRWVPNEAGMGRWASFSASAPLRRTT